MEISVIMPSVTNMDSNADASRIKPFISNNSAISRSRKICAIVAMGIDRAIGKEGGIPWRLKEDLQHFKTITMGHPVIMGRKTWESLPKKPLPGRRNIVVTRNPEYIAEGAETAASVEEAVSRCSASEVPFIIGGSQIYKTSLDLCSEVYVTEVELTTPDADSYFPELNPEIWSVNEKGDQQTSGNGIPYRFVTYSRL